MLRRPSFEEKYLRTSSPAGSDTIAGSSRSDSPSAALWDTVQQPADNADTHHAAVYRANVSRDTDTLSTVARPFVAVTSRTRSPAVVNSRPVSGPPRQFITAPPATTVPSVTPHPQVTSSAQPISSAVIPPIAQPVPCVTVTLPAVSVGPSNGFQIAAATALPTVQLGFATSPLDCRRDVTVTSAASSPGGATARSSRPPTVVLQQVPVIFQLSKYLLILELLN